MIERGDALSLTQIAALAEVGISAASNWRKRHRSFPDPRHVEGQELYAVDDVVAWLRGRRISQNSLKSTEAPGTTYGDRFLRNRGAVDAVEARTVEPDTTGARPRQADREHRLWAIVERMRGLLDPTSIVDHVLGLLYLKIGDQRLWHSLVHAPNRSVEHRLLMSATFPTLDGSRLPIFDLGGRSATPDPSTTELIHTIDSSVVGGEAERLDIASRLCDEFLERVDIAFFQYSGHRTPPSLARCMVEILDPRSAARVYDPICGSGELLAAAGHNLSRRGDAEPIVFGQALDVRTRRTAVLTLALHGIRGDVRTHDTSILDDAFPDELFDVVLTNPPFNRMPAESGLDRLPFGEPSAQHSYHAWLQHAVTKLDEGGRAAVLMPNATTFTTNKMDLRVRRSMIEAGVVDCVVALPNNLFKSTAISTCLWVLSKPGERAHVGETLFIDATNAGVVKNRTDRTLSDQDISRIATEYHSWISATTSTSDHPERTGFSRSVRHTEIQSNGWDLQPTAYVRSPGQDTEPPGSPEAFSEAVGAQLRELHERSDAARTDLTARLGSTSALIPSPSAWSNVPLGEVADVLAGPATMSREGSGSSWTPIVLPRNIWFGRVDQGKRDSVSAATAARQVRYRLEPGDVICARTGTLGRYGLVDSTAAGWLVGPGCMRLRPNDLVHPVYLLHYLGSPGALEWLMENSNQSVIRYISTDDLRQLPVQLPPMSTQVELAATFEAFDAQASAHRRLAEETEKARNLLLPVVLPKPPRG